MRVKSCISWTRLDARCVRLLEQIPPLSTLGFPLDGSFSFLTRFTVVRLSSPPLYAKLMSSGFHYLCQCRSFISSTYSYILFCAGWRFLKWGYGFIRVVIKLRMDSLDGDRLRYQRVDLCFLRMLHLSYK